MLKPLSLLTCVFVGVIAMDGCSREVKVLKRPPTMIEAPLQMESDTHRLGPSKLALGLNLEEKIVYDMDTSDLKIIEAATTMALDTLRDWETISWKHPYKKHYGEIRILGTVDDPQSHLICRNWENRFTVELKEDLHMGRACRSVRDPSGAWEPQ